jgi:UDP-3-O-acyl-N-acetylglucosamine deacetylase
MERKAKALNIPFDKTSERNTISQEVGVTAHSSSNALVLAGQDVFRGKPARVEMEWKPDRTESALKWAALPEILRRSEFDRLQPKAERQTILTCHGFPGQVLMHSEHAFAAWLFFANLPFQLNAHTESFPLLDGSALPWREAFSRLARHKGLEAHPPLETDCDLKYGKEWPNGFLRAEPASHFSVTYTVEREAFVSTFHLENAAQAYDEILPARTFIFAEDLARIWNPGTESQIQPESGLLLASSQEEAERAIRRWNLAVEDAGPNQGRLLYPRSYRFSDEPARHKILDLLGDLALGRLELPKLRVVARNAGHDKHHDLLNMIQARRNTAR